MVSVYVTACWVANALFSVAGLWTAFGIASIFHSRRYRHLLWLLPLMLVFAWLESAFASSVTRPSLTEAARWSALLRESAGNVVKWSIMVFVFAKLRHYQPFESPKPSNPHTS